ncbi:MAG: diadenylate cyclase CdaA [Anaerolineae bacterium]|nr:diadenylate cyclase CdaA [Anaerolineae bacterium]
MSWFLRRLGENWWNVFDILLVTLIIYWFLNLIRGTQAVQLLRGVVILAIATVLVANLLPFRAFGWLVAKALPALLVSIPVIFQPELRRALERLGRTGSGLTPLSREISYTEVINEICRACAQLSEKQDGALIVLELATGLEDYIESGVRVDSRVTAELLVTVFFKNTALHDGAVIIRDGRVVAAACVLPLAQGTIPERQMGLRHRAAIGVTEETDAIAVVVSEETGTISVARFGRIIRRLDIKRLRNILQASYHAPAPPDFSSIVKGVRSRVGEFFGRPKR